MHIQVSRLRECDKAQLLGNRGQKGDSSQDIRNQVTAARQRQLHRSGMVNARLDQAELKSCCKLESEDEQYLGQVMQQLKLSTRGFFRILKMARTIADLDGEDNIRRNHLLEAIGLRFRHLADT